MIYSTNISDLRADVAANCRVFIAMMAEAGYAVQIVNTLRDQEYQSYLHNTQGAPATVTFHGCGLAFDVCEKKYGYTRAAFFAKTGEFAQKIGFEWGGSWTHPDRPHIQWSEHGTYTGGMIIAGKRPPDMPFYEEDEDMTQDKFNEMYGAVNPMIATIDDVPDWLRPEVQKLLDAGVINGGTDASISATDINMRLETLRAIAAAKR